MNTPKTYRKKPVKIHAMQFTGTNLGDVKRWVGPRFADDEYERDGFIPVDEQWPDPPAGVTALVWDKLHSTWVGVKDWQWIIEGVQGEFYPCDPDVFAVTYEEAPDAS